LQWFQVCQLQIYTRFALCVVNNLLKFTFREEREPTISELEQELKTEKDKNSELSRKLIDKENETVNLSIKLNNEKSQIEQDFEQRLRVQAEDNESRLSKVSNKFELKIESLESDLEKLNGTHLDKCKEVVELSNCLSEKTNLFEEERSNASQTKSELEERLQQLVQERDGLVSQVRLV
jgi:hypothetical protein